MWQDFSPLHPNEDRSFKTHRWGLGSRPRPWKMQRNWEKTDGEPGCTGL